MDELAQAPSSGGKTQTVFGVVAIVLGVLAMLAPGIAGLSIAMLLGVFVSCTGIVRLLWAFRADSLGKGLLAFALGSLTLLCGILLLSNPVIGSGLLTVLLTAYFILDGIFEIAAGFARPGGFWLIFGGAVSILLGAMIWAQYPLSGAWAMGTLLGIKLFFVGLIMVSGWSAARAFGRA